MNYYLTIKIIELIDDQCYGNKNIFCVRTGLKKITLYKILSEENQNPTIDTILKIKKAFPDINLNWLLADEKNMFNSDYENLANYSKELERKLEIKNRLIEYLKKII